MEIQLTKRQLELKELIQAELECEMAWLRNIDFNNYKDVKYKALELIMSRKNSVTNQAIREIFGGKFFSSQA